MYADIIVGFVRYNLNPPLSSCQLYIEADLQPHHQQQQHNKKLRKIHRGAIPTTTTYAYAAEQQQQQQEFQLIKSMQKALFKQVKHKRQLQQH